MCDVATLLCLLCVAMALQLSSERPGAERAFILVAVLVISVSWAQLVTESMLKEEEMEATRRPQSSELPTVTSFFGCLLFAELIV